MVKKYRAIKLFNHRQFFAQHCFGGIRDPSDGTTQLPSCQSPDNLAAFILRDHLARVFMRQARPDQT
jgi:hypothetical protein